MVIYGLTRGLTRFHEFLYNCLWRQLPLDSLCWEVQASVLAMASSSPKKNDTGKGTGGTPVWPQTDWSGLRRTAASVGKETDRLQQLILTYQAPLKLELLSTFPALKDEADDLLQQFAQDKILQEGWLAKADKNRGRFRDFLKTSLRNFVTQRLRGRKLFLVSLDELEIDLPAEAPESDAFDREWMHVVLEQALDRMETDAHALVKNQLGRQKTWEVFRLRIRDPIVDGTPPMPYGDLVIMLALRSPSQAMNLLATSKRMFEGHLNAVIAEYETSGDAAVRAEMDAVKTFVATLLRRERA
jgi:hypothetical protein